MRLLLDTHVFLWAAAEPERIAPTVRALITDGANEVFVSAAVAWEIAIKHALGKLTLPIAPAVYVPARLATLGFIELPISAAHALAISGLPNHHNDPFDRIMIAQAQVEGMTFVSADQDALAYPVHALKAV